MTEKHPRVLKNIFNYFIAIFAYGSRVDSALKAGKVLGGSVIDMRFVKPLDEQLNILKNSNQNTLREWRHRYPPNLHGQWQK
jgi:deoxyxylulose-5-phosphate synthase